MECKNDISEKTKDAATGPRIVLNTYSGNTIEGEAFVADHIFSYILQGKQDVWLADQKHSYREGDFRFFRRNQLTKYVKSTTDGSFRSIAVHIDQCTLKEMSEQYGLKANSIIDAHAALLIHSGALLKGFVDSLVPYLQQQMDDRIVSLKAKELVLLLIQHNPAFKNVLFDFNEPGKIDLEAFMNSHYRYNVPMERFAFLTGRSLSGFKRDFEKQFNTSPGRWLLRKRLDTARFLIEQQKEKPSDVYLDLGFEDLSHFSFAYKKEFGYAPNKKHS
ncbi:AraC family transcriptional regulator [Chryseobacterium gallinarum]|uniref:Helix-turn-helix transcriptional regulator n=1 Tax=Chryseobacterium gallinarum TaxID=1324352 RepID=A0ABX6KLJ2_CHRGL|nr:AraC family transcriptional regulator [Chryseobacterium gallinarum]QIY89522.1 helix-turn-helix transcriptional regulator [Chryseobacterium gallinarum]